MVSSESTVISNQVDLRDNGVSTKNKKNKKAKAPVLIHDDYKNVWEAYPTDLRSSKARGRHAVASELIEEGTTVSVEFATAFVVRSPYLDEQCHVCLTSLERSPKKCSQCSKAYYCSQACFELDSDHATICPILAQVDAIGAATDVDADLLRLIVRLLAQRAREDEDVKCQKDKPTPFRCVNELLSHREQADPSFISVVTHAAQRLVSILPPSMAMEPNDIATLACRINANAHGLGDDRGRNTDVALGIFPLSAMFFNHACNPNTAFVGLDHGRLAFRTIRKVNRDEELTVSYIDLYASRDDRRRELLYTKHFWCKCKRCTSPMQSSVDRFLDGVMCRECGKDVYVIPPASIDDITKSTRTIARDESWPCAACKHTLAAKEILAIRDTAAASYASGIEALQQGNYTRACEILGIVADKTNELHPLHSLRLNASIPRMNGLRRKGDIKSAAQVNKAILDKLQAYAEHGLPENTPEMSDFWENLGDLDRAMINASAAHRSAQLVRQRKQAAKNAYLKAYQLRCVVYGDQHPKAAALKPLLTQ